MVTDSTTALRAAGSEWVNASAGQQSDAPAIESIRIGLRALARRPQLALADLPETPFDRASKMNIPRRLAKPTGDYQELTLLQPLALLEEHRAQSAALAAESTQSLDLTREAAAGRGMPKIRSVSVLHGEPQQAVGGISAPGADPAPTNPRNLLSLPEREAVGPAEVGQVDPRLPIESGDGELVTGTCARHSGEVLESTVDVLPEPIGGTRIDPFWCVDPRNSFGEDRLT
jgi:hypothetical protein